VSHLPCGVNSHRAASMLGYIALSAILHDQLQGIVRAIANQYAFRLLLKNQKRKGTKP